MQGTYKSQRNPRSLDEAVQSHSKSKNKMANTAAADIPFSAEVQQLINNWDISTDRSNFNIAVHNQTEKTFEVNKYLRITSLFTKHSIIDLNNNIKRNIPPVNNGFNKADRHYYCLDTNEDTIPQMNKQGLILDWSEKMIKGEQDRIAAGGTPLKSPTWQEIDNWRTITMTKKGEQGTLKIITKNMQVALTTKVDDYCNNIYEKMKDDLKYFYRNLSEEAFRDVAEEWGMIYEIRGQDSDKYGHVIGYITSDDVPLKNVEVIFVDLKLTFKTDISGRFSTNKVPVGTHRVIIRKDEYTEKIIEKFVVKPEFTNELIEELEMILE